MLQIFFDTHKDDDTWDTSCDLYDNNGDDTDWTYWGNSNASSLNDLKSY